MLTVQEIKAKIKRKYPKDRPRWAGKTKLKKTGFHFRVTKKRILSLYYKDLFITNQFDDACFINLSKSN